MDLRKYWANSFSSDSWICTVHGHTRCLWQTRLLFFLIPSSQELLISHCPENNITLSQFPEKPIHPVTIDVDVVPSRQRCPTLHSKFCDLAQVFQFDRESFDCWNVIRSWGRLSIECKIASCPVRKIANYPACKVLRARSSAQAISQKSEVCAQFANCPGPCENVLKINNKIRGICKTILIWSWATWEYLKNL